MKNFPQDGSSSNYVSEEMIGKIKLVKSALKESQRLNPLAVANGRVLQADLLVDNYLIPKGVSSYLFEHISHNFRLKLITNCE